MNTSDINLFHKKYIKYKNKYINLLNSLKGGNIEWYYWSSTNNDWKKIDEKKILDEIESSYKEPKITSDFSKYINENKIKASDNSYRPIYRKNTDNKEFDKKGQWYRWDKDNYEWIYLEELSDLIENNYIKNHPIYEKETSNNKIHIDFDKMILSETNLGKSTTYPLIRKIEKKSEISNVVKKSSISPVIHVYSFPIKNNKTRLRVNKDTKEIGYVEYRNIPSELFQIDPERPEIINIKPNVTSKDYLNIKYSDTYNEQNPKTHAFNISIDYNSEVIGEFESNLENAFQKQNYYLQKILGFDKTKRIVSHDKLGYIIKINQSENEKFIIFGDYHGSFHTFYRNMVRLHLAGVLDIRTFKINENYKIIFLGDIVDRGGYSIEILNFIFMLIISNDIEKVIINRGNHEEYDILTRDGFSDEIESKLKDKSADYLLKIRLFFNLCSTAIILINGEYRYWLCHGCIPCENLDFEKELVSFIKSSEKILIIENPKIALQIRWNDAAASNIDRGLIRNTKCAPDPRGDNIYIINETQFKKYLDIFDFIIRAHQDNFTNAWIVGKDGAYDVGLIEGKDSLYEDKPIKSLVINDQNWFNERRLYKIMTISNNTGAGRNLYNDSFIMISPKGESLPKVNQVTKREEIDWIDDYDFKI